MPKKNIGKDCFLQKPPRQREQRRCGKTEKGGLIEAGLILGAIRYGFNHRLVTSGDLKMLLNHENGYLKLL